MSHRVNSEGFRLGTSRFWKSELFSSYISNFIQKFLAIYLFLKKKLNSAFFKIVFFKIIFLKGQKVLILVNVYRIFRRITNRSLKATNTTGPERVAKTLKGRSLNFKRALGAKKFPPAKEVLVKKSVFRPRKGVFSLTRLQLNYFNFSLERFLGKWLVFPCSIRIKNIFSLKKKLRLAKKINNLLSLCRKVYKISSRFWQLRRFLYLKDFINVLSIAFFYQKSILLSEYIADVIRLRRKFFQDLKSIKSLLPHFKKHYFLIHSASLKINILGKLYGQRRRRFRCFQLSEGVKFSTQDIHLNVSYSLSQTWNNLGSFGVKVWIYKSIIKDVTRVQLTSKKHSP